MFVRFPVATFRVVTLVVERFEVPVTLRAPPKSEAAFIIAAFPLVKTFRVATFARVWTVMFVAFAVATFRVVTLVVKRFEFPVTLRDPPKSEAVFRVVTLVVERFEVPVTFIFVENRLVTFSVRAFD